MADYIKLHAQQRQVTGKKVAELRRDGWTPAVIYGHHDAPVALQIGAKDLHRAIYAAGTSHLVEIVVEGERKPRMALVREVQRHVTRHTILHADFMQVRMDEKVRSEVPVVVTGEPELVARHEGVLDQPLVTLQIEALPADLPAEVQVDASVLANFGDAILVSDLELGANVTVLNPSDEGIVRLMPVSRAVLHELEEMAAEAEAASEDAAAVARAEAPADKEAAAPDETE